METIVTSQPRRFAYASLLSDDLSATVDVLSAIGFTKTWVGFHPFLNCQSTLVASRNGGILILQSGQDAHPSLSAVAASKESWFHFALAGPTLDPGEWSGVVGLEVSEIYEGPVGAAVMVRVAMPDAGELWVEMLASTAGVSAAESTFARVESTALVSSDRVEMAKRLAPLSLTADPRLDAFFPTLAGVNRIVVLDWHYLEFVEPTGEGVISGLRQRLSRPGIFGLNVEPVDMDAFLSVVSDIQLDVNSAVPIVLPVVADERDVACANIITVNPRATGGGRLFVLTPLEYPWKMLP